MSAKATRTGHYKIIAVVLFVLNLLMFLPAPAEAQTIDLSSPISLEGFAWSGYRESDVGTCTEETQADVMMIMDRSESMQTNDPADETAQTGIDLANSLDFSTGLVQMGIIPYSTRAALQQSLTSNRSNIISSFQTLPSFLGTTNLNQALIIAREEFIANANPSTENIAIILTDGANNRPDETAVSAANLRAAGVRIVVIGLSLDGPGALPSFNLPRVVEYNEDNIVSAPVEDNFFLIDNVSEYRQILNNVVYNRCNTGRVGVGWIDMSDVSVMPDGSNPMRGNLEGYAWSDNIGWIKFGGLSGWPTSGNTQQHNARLNAANGQLSGWARACAATVGGNRTSMATNPNSGGWDGWISLRGGSDDSSGYGVRFSRTANADGALPIHTGPGARIGDRYAWGGSIVMGWVDFSQVTLGGTATVANSITATDCAIDPGFSECDTTVQWNANGLSDPEIRFNRGIGTVFTPLAMTGPRDQSLSGANTSYTVELLDGGTVIDSAVIQVSCVAPSEWDPISGLCLVPDPDKPDLALDGFSGSAGSYDAATGEYNNVSLRFRILNQGATTTAYEGESRVEWEASYIDTYWPASGSDSDDVAAIVDGSSRIDYVRAGQLPFGEYEFTVTVDPDDEIDEEVEGNNVETTIVSLAPQDPSMSLTLDSSIVRSGDTATLRWDTVASYPMDCTISGPGISTFNFNPNSSGSTGSITTDARYNAAIYTLICSVLHPAFTDISYSATARLEVIPRLEEI